MRTRAEVLKLRASLDDELRQINEKEAGKGYEDAIQIAQDFSQFFTSEQKKELAEKFGFVSPAPKKAKKKAKKAQTGPKKYILPTGESWGGQGRTPKAFADWKEKNKGKDFPQNPSWTAPKAK